MGTAIAQVLATAGASVTCCDRSARQLETAARLVDHGRYGWERAVERSKLTPAEAEAARARLRFDATLDAVTTADLVIEAIPEDLAAKMRLFADLSLRAPDGAILASNTSGLPILALAEASGRSDHVIGWHWSSPAQVMALAEIVTTDETAPEVVATICELARACGKNPIVITENPQAWGFVVNRVLRAAIREARLIEQEGVASGTDIDQLMVDALGWPTGPLSVLVGAGEGWGDERSSSVPSLLS